jgi:hypothetical protein
MSIQVDSFWRTILAPSSNSIHRALSFRTPSPRQRQSAPLPFRCFPTIPRWWRPMPPAARWTAQILSTGRMSILALRGETLSASEICCQPTHGTHHFVLRRFARTTKTRKIRQSFSVQITGWITGRPFNDSGEKTFSLGDGWICLIVGFTTRALEFVHRFCRYVADQEGVGPTTR